MTQNPNVAQRVCVAVLLGLFGLSCNENRQDKPKAESSASVRNEDKGSQPSTVVQVNVNPPLEGANRAVPVEAGRVPPALPGASPTDGRDKADYPDPPDRETREPERLIRYFCKCWKDEEYKSMYGMLLPALRTELTYDAFQKRYVEDAGFNSGLKDEALLERTEDTGSEVAFKVRLTFQSSKAAPRTVVARLKKTSSGYRVMESGLIPLDLDHQ